MLSWTDASGDPFPAFRALGGELFRRVPSSWTDPSGDPVPGFRALGCEVRRAWLWLPLAARQGVKWAALLGALGCLGYASVWRFPPWLEMRLGYGDEAEEQILRLAWLSQEVGKLAEGSRLRGWRVSQSRMWLRLEGAIPPGAQKG